MTSLSNTDSIFFLPRSGGRHPYLTSDPAMTSERGHVDFDERDPLYRRDLGYQVAGAPALFNASEPHPPGYYPESHNSPFTYQGSNPMFFNDTFPQTAGGTHHQPRPRSRSQPNQGSSSRRFPSDPNDPRSPKPTNLSQGHQQEYSEHPGPYRERAATAPRDPSPPHHHPGFQFIMQAPPPYKKSSGGSSGTLPVKPSDTLDEPSPQSFDGTLGDLEGRPGAGGRSHYDGPLRDRSRGDFHRPQMPDEPQRGYDAAFRRVPEQVPQNGYDGPFQSFQSEEDDDVFPSPLSHFPSHQPTFPRHSSMKPGAQQTYLTGGRGVENEGPPGLTLSDISSVLDPPADQSATLPVPLPPPRPSWQPSQESSRSFPLPSTYSTDASQEALEPSPGDTGRGSQRSRERDRPLARMWPSSKPLADDSSDSSGRPLGYTRDQLHDVVDRLRQAPRSRSAPDSQPGERYLDVSAGGMIPGVNGGYRGEGSGHPGSWLFGEDSTSSGLGSRNTSHSAGSLRPKPPNGAGNSQPYTDNSYAGNSLSSLAIPSSFSLVGDDTTPSSTSQPFSRPPSSSNRRDTSTDENYEFDHLPALESDILDDLQRYSRLAGSRQASGLEGGQHFGNSSSPDAVMRELYPRPRKQSQYSDAAERFERLREEFQQFRHQQASSPPYSGTSRHPDHSLPHQNQQPLYPMDSEML